MANKRWKAYERRVAKFFGTKRTPLSGINSGHSTHSDTLHPRLYLEVKSAAANAGSNAYVWRTVHGLPAGIHKAHGASQLYFVHSSVIAEPKWGLCDDTQMPDALFRLFCSTNELAIAEDKLVLLALCTKGSRGFWLLGLIDALLAAARERALVENAQAQPNT